MQANKSGDKMQNLHYFVVANLPKEHDELLALMHNWLISVVSTSVVTTIRTLSTCKISAQGVKGEEPKIEHHIVAYCQNIPGNVDPTTFKADCAKYVQSREHDGIDEHYEGNKNMK